MLPEDYQGDIIMKVFILGLIFGFLIVALNACSYKSYTLEDANKDATSVKLCMGVEDVLPDAALVIIPGDKVVIGGNEYCGSYADGVITLPKNDKGEINIACFRHELVHHIVHSTTNLGNDKNHEAASPQHPTQPGSAYLDCSELIQE